MSLKSCASSRESRLIACSPRPDAITFLVVTSSSCWIAGESECFRGNSMYLRALA